MSRSVTETGSREPVRRHLSERQADTVERLTAAAVEEVRSAGYDGLSVRNVARRAGVAPATAYTYFASKDHLVAEVFRRRLQAQAVTPTEPGADPAERVIAAVGDIAEIVAAEPELAAACTSALLASDPDVARLRGIIGLGLTSRIVDAVGPDADPAAADAVSLALSGAMLQAGMGAFAHADLVERMRPVVALVLGDR